MNSLKTVSISSNYEYQGVLVECRHIQHDISDEKLMSKTFYMMTLQLYQKAWRGLSNQKKASFEFLVTFDYIQTLLLQ